MPSIAIVNIHLLHGTMYLHQISGRYLKSLKCRNVVRGGQTDGRTDLPIALFLCTFSHSWAHGLQPPCCGCNPGVHLSVNLSIRYVWGEIPVRPSVCPFKNMTLWGATSSCSYACPFEMLLCGMQPIAVHLIFHLCGGEAQLFTEGGSNMLLILHTKYCSKYSHLTFLIKTGV